MADILIDVEVRGNKGVTNAVKNVQTLQTNVKRLSDAMKTGALSQRQYYKGIDQLANATGKSSKELRDYATALRKVERETKAAKAAQEQEAAAVKAYAQARRDALAANQRYDAEQKAALATQKQHEQNLERLRMKFVEGHAAMDIYSKELNDLAVARKNDIITAQQQEAAVEQLNKELANGTIVQRGYSNGLNRSSRGIGQFSTFTQQAGYQVGDFLVQVQSGTNWMVAFGQQATQIAGTLTLFGGKMVAIGTALGIAIPLLTALGAAWMRTRETGSDLADEITRIDKELKKLVKTKEAFSKGMTLDQLFATDELSRVRGELESIRAVYESLSAETIGRSLLGAIPGAAALGLDDAARLEELRELEAKALQRIADLEQKIAEERSKNFSEQKRELDDQLRLQEEMFKFGKDSSQVRMLELEQQIAARKREIDEQVKSKEITIDQGIALKELVEEQLRNEAALEGSVALSETFKSIMEGISLDNLLSQMDSLNSKLGSAIFGAGTFGGRIRGLFDDAVDLAERTKMQQDINRARQEGFRFDSTKTEGGISKTQAFFTGEMGFTNIPEDIPGRLTPVKPKKGGGSKQTPEEKADDYLRKLELEAEYKQKIIGLSEREARVMEIRTELEKKKLPIDDERIQQIVDMEEKTRKLMEAEKQREQLMDTIESNIENAFMSMVDGSKSVEDAFKSMLRNIILAIYQEKVAKAGANAIMSLLGLANGGAFERGGKFTAYANGGVVGSPTMFSHSGGLGVMGEAGPEAIMPLKRGKNGKLGVQMEGNSGNVTVIQNFNMSANGDESVKRIIRQETPRIAEQAKAAVVDAKRRGGSYGRSF